MSLVVVQGEHLYPRSEFDGQADDLDPDLVGVEAVEGQTGQAGVLGSADAVLAAGAVSVS